MPAGAQAGVTATVVVNGLEGRVLIPHGFGPGQRFVLMAPKPHTEAGHSIHPTPQPPPQVQPPLPRQASGPSLPPGWELKRAPDGRPYYANARTMTTQWHPPVPTATAGPARKVYYHVHQGMYSPMRREDNSKIAVAKERGDRAVRLDDVPLQNGTVLRFEIRFGEYGGVFAQRTGMMQINLDTGNQREVEEHEPPQQAQGGAGARVAPQPQPAAQVPQQPTAPTVGTPRGPGAGEPSAGGTPRAPAQPAAASAGGPAGGEERAADANAQLQAQLLGISDEEEIKKLKRRNMVLTEVVRSEESYCSALETVFVRVHNPKSLLSLVWRPAHGPFSPGLCLISCMAWPSGRHLVWPPSIRAPAASRATTSR